MLPLDDARRDIGVYFNNDTVPLFRPSAPPDSFRWKEMRQGTGTKLAKGCLDRRLGNFGSRP
ncbi:MAG: hypothetical protein QOE90_3502 [Thermoplasmata archaeon]|nr:hypothetical protein [Thermoplasmata archaeon]